jgi:hypothetical protein
MCKEMPVIPVNLVGGPEKNDQKKWRPRRRRGTSSRWPKKPTLLFSRSEMMRQKNEKSCVIWYDAVTVGGELKWQNELNEKNKVSLKKKS